MVIPTGIFQNRNKMFICVSLLCNFLTFYSKLEIFWFILQGHEVYKNCACICLFDCVWLCVGHNYKPILTSPCNLNPKLTKGNTNQAQTNDPLWSGCEPQTVPSKQFFCLVPDYTPTPHPANKPSSHKPPLFTSRVIYSQAEIDIILESNLRLESNRHSGPHTPYYSQLLK